MQPASSSEELKKRAKESPQMIGRFVVDGHDKRRDISQLEVESIN